MAYNKDAQARYDKKCTMIAAKLYPNTDRDIIEYIEQTSEPTATLIKRLIREEIARKAIPTE
jgi:hypothetical protein